jgi:hypothetical protein
VAAIITISDTADQTMGFVLADVSGKGVRRS